MISRILISGLKLVANALATYFSSYIDELRYIHDNGGLAGDITNNPEYWVNLEKPSHFEEDEVVSTIADVLIANYDFRKGMLNFK